MIDENSTKAEVMEAVRRSGSALQYASAALKGDRKVLLEAGRQDVNALQYASIDMRNDQEVKND